MDTILAQAHVHMRCTFHACKRARTCTHTHASMHYAYNNIHVCKCMHPCAKLMEPLFVCTCAQVWSTC